MRSLLIGNDSPLHHLPSALDISQSMFFDGIRYSIDMADESYLRCVDALVSISRVGPDSRQMVAAFQSAWSLVDSANRLRVLLAQMRGAKRTPDMRLFLLELAPAEELRNAVQHLPGTIASASEADEPTWGSLSWVVPPEEGSRQGSIFIAIPGSSHSMSRPAVNPLGKEVDRPVGLIELTAFEVTLSISGTHAAIARFTPGFERAAGDAFEAHAERRGADLLVEVSFEAAEEPGRPSR
jgi:hypothetical protein